MQTKVLINITLYISILNVFILIIYAGLRTEILLQILDKIDF